MSVARPVTDESFETQVRASARPVIVEYWAEWCGPCRQVGPILEAIAADYGGAIDVVKLNVDDNPRTALEYNVLAVPTVSLFVAGQVVKQVVGARSKAALLRDFADYL